MASKKRKLLARGAFLLSCLAMWGAYTGCAQDVGTVDRSRPDKLKKSLFDNNDEWYFLQTVVSTDFQGSNAITVGEQSLLKRIRWTITEDTLFAYSTTEPAIGTDAGTQDPKDRRLGVVAAFPIQKHFDVQRGYNSSTGQLSNVIEENSSDRLWYQRDYMRVDWSSNRIDGIGLFSATYGHFSSISRTVPEADSVTDYDRTRISDNYIDVVSEYFFQPDFRSCAASFGVDAIYNCEAGPVKVRNSFLKVPKKKTFEPVQYFDYMTLKDDKGMPIKVADGSLGDVACSPEVKQLALGLSSGTDPDVCLDTAKFDLFNRFGFFRTERTIYTPRRGARYFAEKRFYANHWNIWQTAYDENGKLLPLEKRHPKQIVYYLNVGFPEDKPYMDGAKALEQDWNRVLVNAVRLALNIQDLDGASVYAWLTELNEKASAIDKARYLAQGDTPSDTNIEKRVGYDSTAGKVIPGSPLFYALKGVEQLKKIDADHPGTSLGWDNFCDQDSNRKALGFPSDSDCKSGDVEQTLFSEITKQAAVYLATTQSYNLSIDLPAYSVVSMLARVYLFSTEAKDSKKGLSQVDVDKYTKVFESTVAQKERKNLPVANFQKGNEKVESIIAQYNNGDKRMYRLEENSCSPTKLVEWQKKYGDVNEDVRNLFSGKDLNAIRALPLEGLKKFCASLEWYTRNEQDKEKRFDWQRQGDLRYSFVTWVPQQVFWLGFGPTASDPETGESISAAANFAGAAIKGYAAMAADFQLYFNGVISEDQFLSGDYVDKDFDHLDTQGTFLVKPKSTQAQQLLSKSTLSASLQRTPEERKAYQRALINYANSDAAKEAAEKIGKLDKLESLKKTIQDIQESGLLDGKKQLVNYQGFLQQQQEKMRKIVEISKDPSVIAAHLAAPQYAAALDLLAKERYGEDVTPTKDQRDTIIAELADPTLIVRNKDAIMRERSLRNYYPLEALEQNLTASIIYQASAEHFKNKSRKEIEDYFNKGVFFGTQVHEVGHTLGLRHNFAGSYDPLNYPRGWWEVLAHTYEDPSLADKSYLSKEDFEKLTGDKLPGTTEYFNKPLFRSSSIMDYTVGANSGFPGSGRYDEAAINFLYAKRIEVFDQSLYDYLPPVGSSRLELFKNYAGRARAGFSFRFVNYKDFPFFFSQVPITQASFGAIMSSTKLGTLDDKLKKQYYPTGIRNMMQARRWVPVKDAIKSYVDYLEEGKEKVVEFAKTKPSMPLDDIAKNRLNSTLSQRMRQIDVPYAFCTDDYAGGQLGCSRFDWGATQEEILHYKIDQFETFKNRSRYWHGVSFPRLSNVVRYLGSLSSNFYAVQQPFYYYYNFVRRPLAFFTYDMRAASIEGVNFMARMYAQPQVGTYCLDQDTSTLPPSKQVYHLQVYGDCDTNAALVDVSRDQGVQMDWGYQQTYRNQFSRISGFYEKELAIQYLFLVSGSYYRAQYQNELNAAQGSFWTVFQEPILRFLTGVVLNRPELYAGHIVNGKYEPPTLLSKERLMAEARGEAPGPMDPNHDKPYVSTVSGFTYGYDAILYSLLLNNTYLDDQFDTIQFMKVCASNDECDDSYLKIDDTMDKTVSADSYPFDIRNGRKVVTYKQPKGYEINPKGGIVPDGTGTNDMTDVASTTYYTANGMKVKTFVHPTLPIIYRAPIRVAFVADPDNPGKFKEEEKPSITGELIDTLNDLVYGDKEPSYKAVVSRGVSGNEYAVGLYLFFEKKYNEMSALPAGAPKYDGNIKSAYEGMKGSLEYYGAKLQIIRDVMKRTRGLY